MYMGRYYSTPPDRFRPYEHIRVGVASLEKRCTKCKKWKQLCYETFGKTSQKAYGFKEQCRQCGYDYALEYKKRDK